MSSSKEIVECVVRPTLRLYDLLQGQTSLQDVSTSQRVLAVQKMSTRRILSRLSEFADQCPPYSDEDCDLIWEALGRLQCLALSHTASKVDTNDGDSLRAVIFDLVCTFRAISLGDACDYLHRS